MPRNKRQQVTLLQLECAECRERIDLSEEDLICKMCRNQAVENAQDEGYDNATEEICTFRKEKDTFGRWLHEELLHHMAANNSIQVSLDMIAKTILETRT